MTSQEYNRQYYKKNRVRLIVQTTKYKKDNPEKTRKLRKLTNRRCIQSGYAGRKRQEYIDRNLLWVSNYKAEKGCLVCEENCPACLLFHHDEDNKEMGVAQLAGQCYSIKRIVEEVDKCTVLCFNCHQKYHAGLIYFT